jgi:hypothetical protein
MVCDLSENSVFQLHAERCGRVQSQPTGFARIKKTRGQSEFPSRFHLRARYRRAIGADVNGRTLCLLVCMTGFSSCREKPEVVVTETREMTTRDKTPRLFATSDQRFRDAKPSPVKGRPPERWLAVPATQFRLLNYRFGASGQGEAWVTLAAGSVLDNVNRWLGQFGATPIDAAALEQLRKVPIAGGNGVWVDAAGEYASGMGAPPKPGFALAGVVSSINGEILTVKMVGPKAEVDAARTDLENFAKSVELAD